MAKTDKPIPKSLHTITALVDVARHVMATASYTTDKARKNPTPENAIGEAMRVLNLAGRDDPHSLEATSLRFLKQRLATES